MYSIVVKDSDVDRNQVMSQMAATGIETRPIFYPVHWMPPYQEPVGGYPVAEFHSSHGISLPTHGKLSEEDVAYVCEQLVASVQQLVAEPQRAEQRRAA